MAIEIKYALNMAKQYNEANEFNIEDYLLSDNETGKLFLTESPSKRVLNESEKSALYFLIDDSLFNASAMYEMYDSGNNKLSEFLIPLGYNHLIHNAIPVNVDLLPVTIDTTQIDVSIVSNQNILPFGSEFDQWNTADVTVDTNVAIAPDGTMTADKLTASLGSADPNIGETITTSQQDVTFSVWLWTDVGQPTPATLFLFSAGLVEVFSTPIILTTKPVNYSLPVQFLNNPVNITARIDLDVTGVGQHIYAWGGQLTSTINNYLTEVKSYQIDRECYDYLFQVNWLNKLGGRDTFMFGAKPIIETSVDRNNLIELSKLRNFESPKRIYGYREHISRKTYTLSHRCKDRDTAEWVKRELIDSIDVMMVINDYYYPVLVLNSSIQEDKVSHDYIVTFQLRLAFDNNIQTR